MINSLDLSTFIQISQRALKEHDRQYPAGLFLLEALNNPDDRRFEIYYINIDDKRISKIVSRQSPVPDEIKQAALVPELAQAALDYFNEKVVADLNPYTKDDALSKLADIIKADGYISDVKRNELLDDYNNGDDGSFLGNTFLYVVNRPNTDSIVDCNDAPLISEANYECPLCNRKLVEIVKDNPIKRYIITQIYPPKIPKKREREFSVIYPKPKDRIAMDNLIALCEQCSRDYQNNPTPEEFRKLHEIKSSISQSYKAKSAVNTICLENEIRVIVDALSNIDSNTPLEQLEYDAIHIDEKIDANNRILSNDIQMMVLQYYRYIESAFSNSDVDFDLVASEIKASSLKLEKSGMSQMDVIDHLAEWIRNKASLGTDSKLACKAVVSFFIQNCEVFYKHEISK